MVTELIETLASYVPALITRRLAANPTPIDSPTAETFPAAVLFADISGFTALTEHLAQKGPAGAEELTQHLNTYFGQLIDLITTYGGDIVKFAGDALIALWPAFNETGRYDPACLPAAVEQAAQCSLVVQQRLNAYEVAAGVRLSLKLALGAGDVLTMHLGGVYGRWEFLVTGAPLIQVGLAGGHAQPGDTILSPEAWSLLPETAVGSPVSLGATSPPGSANGGSKRALRLTGLRQSGSILPLAANGTTPLAAEAEAGLRAFIPGAILARLAAGQAGWLAELRRVTVIFINLHDLDYAMPLEQAQSLMQTLQTSLYRYEGSINKLSVDDKGVTLIAALGLPPLAHEDDPARGIQVALAVQAELRRMGLRSAIGVTSGRAFCGMVGNNRRREYTMIGDVVNLAARLMQAASDSILCDAATYNAAQAQLNFEALPPMKVKGKAEPVAVYRPLSLKAGASRRQTTLVGRQAERELLTSHLQTLLRGTGGIIVIEGEAGVGKSRLIEELLRQAYALGVLGWLGIASAIDKSTPYHAWRPVFKQLFNLESLPDEPGLRRAHVQQQLETWFVPLPASSALPGQAGTVEGAASSPTLGQLAPLLNPVLSLDWPENEITEHMTGKVRADNTHELLLHLLQQAVHRDGEIMLVLEDAHWLDSASWGLALLVAQRVHPIMLVLATRPLIEPLPPEYSQLLRDPNTHQITLNTLPLADMVTLVCQRLGVASLPDSLAELIYAKTEGNPFFGEELAYALRDSGLITIASGECRLTPQAADFQNLYLPDTVQGVITSRIDRLTPPQQLTLKVASVIGRVFEFETLHDIHPIEADKTRLPDYLSGLARLDITELEVPEPDLTYIFKHIITQEVAYNMMLFAQRRELHRAVGDWYEQTYVDDLSPFYSRLAFHWQQANVIPKALDYLEKAGEQALRSYANEEAVEFFSDALALAEAERGRHAEGQGSRGTREKPKAVSPTFQPSNLPTFQSSNLPTLQRQARWELKLGEAYVNWVKFSEGRAHLEQGLTLLGKPMPSGKINLITGLVGQVLQQALYRLWPARYLGRQAAESDILLEAARAYEGLTAVYYFANETVPSLYAAFRSLTLAEAAGPSPELARGYASVGVIIGFVPFHALAESYCRRALEMTRRIHNLPARAWVALLTGIYYAGVGRWEQARDLLRQVIDISERLGDRGRRDDGVGNLAMVEYFQGRFAQCAKLYDEYWLSAKRRRDAHNQAWALRGQVYCLLPEGDFEEALRRLETLETLLAENTHVVDEALHIDLQGLKALTHLRQGDAELALAAAEEASQLIAKTSPTSFLSLPGYAGAAEVQLLLWEAAFTGQNSKTNVKDLKAGAQRACRALQAYARVFPIGQPRAYLWQGVLEWVSGRRGRARKWWAKSLRAAEKLDMPYPAGLAHFEIGQRLPLTDPARPRHLARACRIFTRLGAAYDLERAQEALRCTTPNKAA
ncbi:MAG: AAA family ATPase [Anaerolineae bacterium]|nr:AAA family ATPase [Anaerolineae bacterium]